MADVLLGTLARAHVRSLAYQFGVEAGGDIDSLRNRQIARGRRRVEPEAEVDTGRISIDDDDGKLVERPRERCVRAACDDQKCEEHQGRAEDDSRYVCVARLHRLAPPQPVVRMAE